MIHFPHPTRPQYSACGHPIIARWLSRNVWAVGCGNCKTTAAYKRAADVDDHAEEAPPESGAFASTGYEARR